MPIDFIEALPKNDKKTFSSIEKKLQLTLSVCLSVCLSVGTLLKPEYLGPTWQAGQAWTEREVARVRVIVS